MARSRPSSPSVRSSSAHRASAPAPAPAVHHASAAKPAPTPAPQQQHQQTPHSSAPTTTNIYVQRGGGGGSGMLGTMAAVAGGSVIGHGISNYLYGGSHAAPTQPAEAQELASAAAEQHHACTPQLQGYAKCLEANPENPQQCGWAWDFFQQCQREQPQQ